MFTIFFKHGCSDVHFHSTVHFPSLLQKNHYHQVDIAPIHSVHLQTSVNSDAPIRWVTSIPITVSIPGTRWSTTIDSVFISHLLMFRLMLLTLLHLTSLPLNTLMLVFPIHQYTKSACIRMVMQPVSTRALTPLPQLRRQFLVSPPILCRDTNWRLGTPSFVSLTVSGNVSELVAIIVLQPHQMLLAVSAKILSATFISLNECPLTASLYISSWYFWHWLRLQRSIAS